MEKKYLALICLVLVGSISTVGAILYFQQVLPMTLISLDSAVRVTNLMDIDITSMDPLSLYVGESESVFFKVHNNYDEPITLVFDVIFGGTGFSLGDSTIGVSVMGAGYVPLLLGDPLILDVGQWTEVGINIIHSEPASSPTVEIVITAE